MKYFLFLLSALLSFGVYAADSVKADITSQGNTSYLHKSVTAQQLSATVRDYEDTTAANTLLYTECGKTVWLNSATEFATTLPLPVAGCSFKFFIKAAPAAADYTVVTNGGADIIIITVNELETDTTEDGVSDDNADVFTFKDGVSVVGDYVGCISDGTSWYCTGQVVADGALTTGTT